MPTRIYSAGQLNQQVQLQQRQAATNGLREAVGAWVDMGSPAWAQVTFLAGREQLAAGAAQQTADARFVLRYRAGVTPSMRLVHKGRPFDIVSAEPVDGGIEWLEILAVHGVRDGRD